MKAISTLVSGADKLAPRISILDDFEKQTRDRMEQVRRLTAELEPWVEPAFAEWDERENCFLDAIGATRSEFLDRAGQEIANFASGRSNLGLPGALIGEANARLITVPNIGWVHAFAWILPEADPKHAERYRSIGEMMATIMAYESVLKWPDELPKFMLLRSIAGTVNS